MTDAPRPPCRHCHARPGARPRNLCARCYDTPAVRAATPTLTPPPRLPACTVCGHVYGGSGAAAHRNRRRNDVCPTCQWPEPFRTLRHALIAEYERRVAADPPEALPLFAYGRRDVY